MTETMFLPIRPPLATPNRRGFLEIAAMATTALICPGGAAAQAGAWQNLDVTFAGDGGERLAGTLCLPARPARALAPAMLLIAGSGPTDRNGNQAPAHVTNLLLQCAELLASHGVASLRFDKRGVGPRSPPPADPAQQSEFFRFSHYVNDAAGALKALADHPGIDRDRIGILGHSEGGMIALALTQHPDIAVRPATLILASTPGRPADVVIRDQLEGLMEHRHTTPETQAAVLSQEEAITRSLKDRDALPETVPPGLKPLFPVNLTHFWHEQLNFSSETAARGYHGPVLILQGRDDHLVSADKDASALDRALGSRTASEHLLVVVDGVGHSLEVASGGDGVPQLARAAADAIEHWVEQTLKADT